MLKIEKFVTASPEQWEIVIEGTRNPMNSWHRMDSEHKFESDHDLSGGYYEIGPNDHDLMMRLAKGGPVHGKYRRMIPVYVTLTAPLYWWKEMDTYKVGTVCNSCSTMHKIHAKEFTMEDFSCEHLMGFRDTSDSDSPYINGVYTTSRGILYNTIECLNFYRSKFLETKDKTYWWQMIQLLPTSYNQKRTLLLNYEVLHNIYHSRKGHKLDEWKTLLDWIEELPYSEIITGKTEQEAEV